MLVPAFARFLHLVSVVIVGASAFAMAFFFYWRFFGWPDFSGASIAPVVALGATLTGMLFWLIGMWRVDFVTNTYTNVALRGILIGVISGLVAFPVIGVLLYLQLSLRHVPVQFPRDLIAYILISLLFSVLFGFIPIIMGGLAGWLIAVGTKYITVSLALHLKNSPPCLRRCALLQAALLS